MTSWMKERDRLVEQTLAFVEGVASQRPMKIAATNVESSAPASANSVSANSASANSVSANSASANSVSAMSASALSQPVIEPVVTQPAISIPVSTNASLVEAEALMSLIAMSLPSLRTQTVAVTPSPIVITKNDQPEGADTKQREPERKAPVHIPAPKRSNPIVLPERDMIAQRVAHFRAGQQKLIREREDHNAAVQAKIRATLKSDPLA